MNVLAALLGGSVIAGGAVALGVLGKQKPGDRVEAYPGTQVTLTFVATRVLSANDVGALLWSFQDNFPGTIEGFAAVEPTVVMANIVMNSPAALEIGSVGVFADIVLQLTEAKIVGNVTVPTDDVPPVAPVYA
jgi:hypothetical protein